MKKYLIYLLLIISISINAQEYEFINEVITPFEDNNPIQLDSIFLKNRFIILGDNHLKYSHLNEDSFRMLWDIMGNKQEPPVELFLMNFNFEHLKADIIKSQNDSIVDFNKLNKYFYSTDEVFIKNNPKKKYISISQPFFNDVKDWCFIIKNEFIPYTNTGGNSVMFIYIKIDDIWILYNTLTLSLT